MQPIFMSPSFDQAKGVKALLARHEIDASIIEKSNHGQVEAGEESIKWFELWLRKHADLDRANAIITQYEFDALKSNLNRQSNAVPVNLQETQPVTISAPYNDRPKTAATAGSTKFHNSLKAHSKLPPSQLPVNNKSVFQRLASVLGVTEDERQTEEHNNVLRPWNSKSLIERVKSLRQLTK